MRGTVRLSTGVLVGAVIVGLFAAAVVTPQADAAINTQINFQGKLTNPDGTNVTNGSYSIRFRIYDHITNDAASACLPGSNSCKFEDTQTLTVTDGIFSYALGSNGLAPLPGSVDFNNAGLYIGVKVGTDAEMTPRIQLSAAPYAFNAERVGGIAATSLVQLSPGAQQTGFIDVSGDITSGGTYNTNTFTSSALQFGAASAATIQAAAAQSLNVTGNAASTFSTSSGQLTLQSGSGTVSLGSSTVLTANAGLSINSATTNSLNLDTGTTGGINIGTNANAKTITIGNSTGGTAIAHIVGAGTNVFNIQGASSAIYMQLDTTNSRFYVGNPTADGTAFALVLDSKNTAGDPATATNGSMYYNSSNNRFRCYENSTWVNCTGGSDNSKSRIMIQDEFISNSVTTNTIGQLGWTVTLTGAATNSINNAAADADHIGLYRCTSSVTNPSGCLLSLGITQSRIWGGERFGAIVRTPSNLTATNLYVGLGDAASGTANSVDAIQFRKISGVANWQGEVLTNSVSTTCDTGVAAVASNYIQVTAVVNAGATAVDFYVNGATTPSCTVTAALPTASGRELGPLFQFRNADTTAAKTGELDLYWHDRVTGNRWQ